MSDLNNDWGGGNASTVSAGSYEASTGKAPYHWLLIGFTLALLEVILFTIFQPAPYIITSLNNKSFKVSCANTS
jgi:hypothetical protein